MAEAEPISLAQEGRGRQILIDYGTQIRPPEEFSEGEIQRRR